MFLMLTSNCNDLYQAHTRDLYNLFSHCVQGNGLTTSKCEWVDKMYTLNTFEKLKVLLCVQFTDVFGRLIARDLILVGYRKSPRALPLTP